MTVDTNNYYGNISISDNAIRTVAGFVALDCYGVVDLVAKNFRESARELFHKERYAKGMIVDTVNVHVVGVCV